MTSVEGTNSMPGQFITGSDVHFDYENTNDNIKQSKEVLSTSASKKKKKKKKKTNSQLKHTDSDSEYPTSRIITGGPQNSVVVTPMESNSHNKTKGKKEHHSTRADIWESSIEGQKALKDFWLTLAKDEQRKLVSISKDSVLQAIKDNDKVNCDCSLCGRKRNAIEKELEVMYESYYDTFNEVHGQDGKVSDSYLSDAAFVDSLFNPLGNSNDGVMSIAEDLLNNNGTKFLDIMEKLAERRMAREDFQHKQAHLRYHQGHSEEYDDDEDNDDVCSECGHMEHEYDDEEDEDEDEDDDIEDDEEEDEDYELLHHSQHFAYDHVQELQRATNISQLQQKQQKQQQQQQQQQSANHKLPLHSDVQNADQILEDISEYEVEEEDDDYEEEDEDGEDGENLDDENYDGTESIDEERRFEEARRMIQLFTTRMFHDRLLERYKLKVANDRSTKLLEELELEEVRKREKEEKKQKQKEKIKEKKRLQQQAKEEERLKRELEKLEQERKLQEEKEKRAEEQRKREEEKRKKKLEELKKKLAEVERQRRERLEKERLKKEEKQRKKDEEKRRKEEELEQKRKLEELEQLKELEKQQEILKQLQIDELEKTKSKLLQQERELQQRQQELQIQHNYESKQLLEGLYKAEHTPSPPLLSNGMLNSPVPLSSHATSSFNQFNPNSHVQQLVSPPHQGLGSQPDFGAIQTFSSFSPPLPLPGVLPMSNFNNSISGSNPYLHNQVISQNNGQPLDMPQIPSLQLPQQQQQQQSQQPPHVTHDAWGHSTTNLNGSSNNLFEGNKTFPPLLEKDNIGGGQNGFANLNAPSFNSFNPLAAANESNKITNGFPTLNSFNDNRWGKSELWISPEPSAVESKNAFNMRSNSIWNGSSVTSPTSLQAQLSQQPTLTQPINPIKNEQQQRGASVPKISGWNNSTSDELTPTTIALIQQATVQSYQQMFALGSNWVARNTLFSQTQAILANVLNLTMSMFLKSISAPNLSYWFEIHYDDYGAASMIRVGNKESSTISLNNGSFQPFSNTERAIPNRKSSGFLPQDPFGTTLNHPEGLNGNSGNNETLFNLWNSTNFTLL